MNIERIKEIAAAEMKDIAKHPYRERGSKYYHGQRVGKIIMFLCNTLSYKENVDVLKVSAWFHDICNTGARGRADHERKGADLTYELLSGYCTEEERRRIAYLISIHDSREADKLSTEARLLQDADMLDHFGIFEIWSCFLYSGREKRSMLDTAQWLKKESRQSYERNRRLLHFDISKKIFDEKQAYVSEFIKRMLMEADGNIIEY